jgi:hypothetical protein
MKARTKEQEIDLDLVCEIGPDLAGAGAEPEGGNLNFQNRLKLTCN